METFSFWRKKGTFSLLSTEREQTTDLAQRSVFKTECFKWCSFEVPVNALLCNEKCVVRRYAPWEREERQGAEELRLSNGLIPYIKYNFTWRKILCCRRTKTLFLYISS